MGENLLTIFNSKEIDADEIQSMSMGRNSKTGKAFARATLSNGTTYIKTLSQAGVKEETVLTIPSYQTIEERREVVRYLYDERHYTQDEIADFCDISQSTVHNDLKKR